MKSIVRKFGLKTNVVWLLFLLAACGGDSDSSNPSKGETSSSSSSASSSASSSSSSNSSSGSSSSSSSSSSSNSSSGQAISCTDESEVIQVFKDNACDVCHNPSFPEENRGGLDLVSPDLAPRVLDVQTYIAQDKPECADGRIVDVANPSDSLMLTLTEQSAHSELQMMGCDRLAMPQNKKFMSTQDHSCVASWVEKVAAGGTGPTDGANDKPFAAADAEMALARAKYVLHGGAPTAAELSTATRASGAFKPAGLRNVISSWENTPEYEAKLRTFLNTALNLNYEDFNQFGSSYFGFGGNGTMPMVAAINNMFKDTAWRIVNEDEDFRSVFTTRRIEMSTGALVAAAAADNNKGLSFSNKVWNKGNGLITAEDLKDVRTINIAPSDSTTPWGGASEDFVAGLRALKDEDTLPMHRPMIGFFTMPTFMSLWETNVDNDYRVTVQQIFIAGLDSRIFAADTTPHLSEEGIPPDHASPGEACYECHRHMDQTRLVFKKYYGDEYGLRSPKDRKEVENMFSPSFSFKGVSKNFDTLEEFAEILANHPAMPVAWVQKLCMWANSQRCSPTDPEAQRLAQLFVDNNYSMKSLIRAFFSSPLFTGTAITKTHQEKNYLLSVARGNHLCFALQHRIDQLKDENGTTGNLKGLCNDNNFLGVIGPDEVSRGDVDWVQNSQITAFESKSIDARCAENADDIIGDTDRQVINVTKGVDQALEQLVTGVIGLPNNHSRYQETLDGLKWIYQVQSHNNTCGKNQAINQGESPSCGFGHDDVTAVRAAWFAACTSPDLVSVGL